MKTVYVYFNEIGCDWSLGAAFVVCEREGETNEAGETLPTEDDVREMVNGERRMLRGVMAAVTGVPDGGGDQVLMD